MSIKHGILAILSRQPTIAYQLKKEFEHLTVGIWPVNDGQIYTTLQRLQRDGLVAPVAGEGDGVPAAGTGQPSYELTDGGRAELHRWLVGVRSAAVPERDELAIKVAFALAGYGGVDRGQLIELLDAQRHEATSSRYEAELRWLEVVEGRLARRPSAGRSGRSGGTT